MKSCSLTMYRQAIYLSICWAVALNSLLADPPRGSTTSPPKWAQEAVWYQIFVERFRNGDTNNDPTAESIVGAWPNIEFTDWETTPWYHDWYLQELWARKSAQPFYKTVYARRYGGDLQGVIDQLDYLKDLGVTALYLNPINDSPSLHKYDARLYRHIDRHFGPNPVDDLRIIAKENPVDPTTWRWTHADRLFLKLIREVHLREMRIIIDVSWNHTGNQFWAWKDLVERQSESLYKDWYDVESLDDPTTAQNEFRFHGWNGVKTLPEFKRVTNADGDVDLPAPVKKHIFRVTRRWLDPNQDGDSSDGVDGFRLDVAAEVPIAFWKEYRNYTRSVHSDCFLLGEIWWEKWPHQLKQPDSYLNLPLFDSVMNYRWFVNARGLFAGAKPKQSPTSFVRKFQHQSKNLTVPTQRSLMNLMSSHDSPRCVTSVYNPGLYKFKVNPRQNRDYRTDAPDPNAKTTQKLMLVYQYTGVGSPHIYYGDEAGMWGADDPDNRKPMVWQDITYQNESANPFANTKSSFAVRFDEDLWRFHRDLISMRKRFSQLFVYGDIEFPIVDDGRQVLGMRRLTDSRNAFVVFNLSTDPRTVVLNHVDLSVLTQIGTVRRTQIDNTTRLSMSPRSAYVLMGKR